MRLPCIFPAFVAMALLSMTAAAQTDDATNPIDKALEACLATDQGQSTAGMVECEGKAYKSWDHELNQTYDALMRSLDPASQGRLRAAQRQWLAFRDADATFQRQEFIIGGGKYGTLARVTLAADNVATIRQRVMTLRTYSRPD